MYTNKFSLENKYNWLVTIGLIILIVELNKQFSLNQENVRLIFNYKKKCKKQRGNNNIVYCWCYVATTMNFNLSFYFLFSNMIITLIKIQTFTRHFIFIFFQILFFWFFCWFFCKFLLVFVGVFFCQFLVVFWFICQLPKLSPFPPGSRACTRHFLPNLFLSIYLLFFCCFVNFVYFFPPGSRACTRRWTTLTSSRPPWRRTRQTPTPSQVRHIE